MDISRSAILRKIPAFTGQRKLVRTNQNVNDIVKEIHFAHGFFHSDYKHIALAFWAGSVQATAKKIFRFLKNNVAYRIEPDYRQTTRSPAAILASGHGDCKHYALWTAGIISTIAEQLNRPVDWCFRFASYRFGDRTPQHVFVVVKNGDREFWIDPVLARFDQRKQYIFHKDFKPSDMALYRVSGVGQYVPGRLVPTFSELSPASQLIIQSMIEILQYMAQERAKLEGRPVQDIINEFNMELAKRSVPIEPTLETPERKGLFKKVWAVIKGVGRGLVKFIGAPARLAFLSLVSLNVFNLAVTLSKVSQTDLKKTWEGLKGQFSHLAGAIRTGKVKPRIAEIEMQIGAVPAVIPAWLALAAPIIAALAPLIKAIADASAKPAIDDSTVVLERISAGEAGAYAGQYMYEADASVSAKESMFGAPGGISTRNLLLIGGGLAALYFLTRKKRTA